MMNKKMERLFIVSFLVIVIVATGSVAILSYIRRPQRVTIRLNVDADAVAALSSAIADYDSATRAIETKILPADSMENADILFDRNMSEGTPWRIRGWRLWARLETIAELEGELGKPLILNLRTGKFAGEDFQELIAEAKKHGLLGFSVPDDPAEYRGAFDRWLGIFAGDGELAKDPAITKTYATTVAALRGAIDLLSRGHALFIIGPDELGEWMPKGFNTHPEAFPLPGSRVQGSSWAIGSMERIRIAPETKKRPAREAANLVTYLTSPGIARSFSEKLPGEFPKWKSKPMSGMLPTTDAPERLVALTGK